MTRFLRTSLVAVALVFLASGAQAENVNIRGASMDLPAGWSVMERVDAVAMESVAIAGEGSLLFLAAAPAEWSQASIATLDMVQDRMNTVLPSLLEPHRKMRFKMGGIKVKGMRGVGTTRQGEDIPVFCGSGQGEAQVLAVCVAAEKSAYRKVIKPLLATVQAGVTGAPLSSSESVEFQGVTLPVPSGWESFMVDSGGLPFVHLAQKQSGFIRAIKLPPAVANLPIPWELVAGWVADMAAGAGSTAEPASPNESIELGGGDSTYMSFKVRAMDKEGRVVFIHPLGRKDLVLFGVGHHSTFEPWFRTYLAELTLDATAMAQEFEGDDKGLLETLEELAPGAKDLLEGLLGGGKKDQDAPEEEGDQD